MRRFVVAVPLLAAVSAFGQFTVPPSTSDVLDVSQGTTITASTPGIVPAPDAAFGGNPGGPEPGTAFAPNVGVGNSSFIEFRSGGRATLNGIRLYAKNDGSGLSFRRAMRAFRLLADVDGNGSFETTATNTAINVNYSIQAGNQATQPDYLELPISFSTLSAEAWRVEFEQGTNIGQFEGVRIIEVDGVSPFTVSPSTSDPLDVSSGAAVTGSTPGILPAPSAVFGANPGGAEPGTAFAPNVGVGNSSFIEVSTPRVTLEGLRLYAANDGQGFSFRRAMRAFRLLADTDGNGSFETTVASATINVNYTLEPANLATKNDYLELAFSFSPVSAQAWRAEFEQGTNIGQFEGVRIIEVDGTAGAECYADCDQSTGPGVLDIFDFLCFQNRYDAGDPYACNCDTSTGPGVCDIFDFLCFQNAYDAGCP